MNKKSIFFLLITSWGTGLCYEPCSKTSLNSSGPQAWYEGYVYSFLERWNDYPATRANVLRNMCDNRLKAALRIEELVKISEESRCSNSIGKLEALNRDLIRIESEYEQALGRHISELTHQSESLWSVRFKDVARFAQRRFSDVRTYVVENPRQSAAVAAIAMGVFVATYWLYKKYKNKRPVVTPVL